LTPDPKPDNAPLYVTKLADVLLRRQQQLTAWERLDDRRQLLAGFALAGLLCAGGRQQLTPSAVREAARIAVDLADAVCAELDVSGAALKKGGA